MAELRVLITAEHASARFGGEAILPLHYFRRLRHRGIDAHLLVHARTERELRALLPDEQERMHFVPDAAVHRLLHAMGRRLPARVAWMSTEFLMRVATARARRQIAQQLIGQAGINLVHEPIPVAPKEPSMMYDLGVPVVIGPMNGGMTFPPAFGHREPRVARHMARLLRPLSAGVHRFIPGKLHAEVLMVANQRTAEALPPGVHGKVVHVVENGVDLDMWAAPQRQRTDDAPVRFVFVGRLVDWKAVDVLIAAFAHINVEPRPTLTLIGDGPMRGPLEQHALQRGVADRVRFTGWLGQAECARELADADVFVLPSLFECGGAVVLEAMASGLPCIATHWGGPADYLDESCGILVEPEGEERFTAGLSASMTRLARDPSLRRDMSLAARQRVAACFDWERKLDHVLQIYDQARRGFALNVGV